MGLVKRLCALCMLALLATSCNSTAPTSPPQSTEPRLVPMRRLTVGGQALTVQVVRTLEEQKQGLSGIASIESNQGMLFVFPEPTHVGFWMKGMRFPLDLIWIRGGKVIGIVSQAPIAPANTEDGNLPIYTPPEKVDSVLEVNAGWAAQHRIGPQTMVEFK